MRQQREKKREKEREREKKKRHPYGCTHPHAPLFYIPSRYIFVTVRSTSIVKKGAQSMMKKCALFSLVQTPFVLEKKKKKKEKEEKSSKRRLKKQTPYRTRVVVRHTRTNNNTRKRERKSDERARERARESDGRTEEVLSFFFARGDVSSIAFF